MKSIKTVRANLDVATLSETTLTCHLSVVANLPRRMRDEGQGSCLNSLCADSAHMPPDDLAAKPCKACHGRRIL